MSKLDRQTGGRRGPPQKMLAQALSYISRLENDPACDGSVLAAELACWRQQPLHEQAYQQALQLWNRTEATVLRGHVEQPAVQAGSAGRRRRALQLLGLGGLALGLTATGRWWWRQPLQELMLATGHGEQLLGQVLQDGSRLDLAALTQLKISLWRDRRCVSLQQGEARFSVARDEGRPFEVRTPWGLVKVLGTVFNVAVHRQGMTVAVAQGRVQVWPSAPMQPTTPMPEAPAIVLEAGQQVEVDGAGVGLLRAVEAGSVGAWREGWLVFDQMPLPQVLARWNNYLRSPLRLQTGVNGVAPRLADLHLTGSFPLRDPKVFIESLPMMLPVTVEWQNDHYRIGLR